MAEQRRGDERAWESGWEVHTIAQRRRLARLSLAEKLEWLEAAQRLVTWLARNRAAKGLSAIYFFFAPPLGFALSASISCFACSFVGSSARDFW